jgi:hypothetical protein
MSAPGPVVSIISESERAPAWYAIFGRLDGIPVTKFTPDVVDLPGRPGVSIYQLHLMRLTAVERSNLLTYMMGKHGMTRQQAELYLDTPGVIIYADDTTCSAPPVIGL